MVRRLLEPCRMACVASQNSAMDVHVDLTLRSQLSQLSLRCVLTRPQLDTSASVCEERLRVHGSADTPRARRAQKGEPCSSLSAWSHPRQARGRRIASIHTRAHTDNTFNPLPGRSWANLRPPVHVHARSHRAFCPATFAYRLRAMCAPFFRTPHPTPLTTHRRAYIRGGGGGLSPHAPREESHGPAVRAARAGSAGAQPHTPQIPMGGNFKNNISRNP